MELYYDISGHPVAVDYNELSMRPLEEAASHSGTALT